MRGGRGGWRSPPRGEVGFQGVQPLLEAQEEPGAGLFFQEIFGARLAHVEDALEILQRKDAHASLQKRLAHG
jgi:hypothetical protein